jgi:hypothetical protein
LSSLLDDQFVIISATAARNKTEEIADLLPQPGNTIEYFRSDDTRTHGFGAMAVISGVLNWKYGGREFQRNHSTIAVKRGAEWKILAQQVTPRASEVAEKPPEVSSQEGEGCFRLAQRARVLRYERAARVSASSALEKRVSRIPARRATSPNDARCTLS